MRLSPVLALAAAAGLAAAQPAPLPPDVAATARAAFAEAQAADQAGDLARAAERYRYVQRIAPHPNVTYNLADVLRRKHDVRGAIEAYRAYLTQLPDAPDRAKVEQLLAGLEATPGDVDVTAKPDDAIVYVDGVRQTTAAPIFLELAPGAHRFDAITPLSFDSDVELVVPTGKHVARLDLPDRVDGNLVVSGAGWLDRAAVTIDGRDGPRERHRLGERLTVPAGKHTLVVTAGDCTWQRVVVAPPRGVAYVYLAVPPPATAAPGRPPPPPACGRGRFAVTRVSFTPPARP